MPENARVILVDDDPTKREFLTEFLIMSGHVVVGTAESLQAGLELIAAMAQLKEQIHVGLFDRNLLGKRNILNRDHGQHLATAFRTAFPDAKVISISSDEVAWSDIPSLTYADGSGAIARAVTEI